MSARSEHSQYLYIDLYIFWAAVQHYVNITNSMYKVTTLVTHTNKTSYRVGYN